MKLKVRIFCALLALTALLFVAACSGEKAPNDGATEPQSTQVVGDSTARQETTEQTETTKMTDATTSSPETTETTKAETTTEKMTSSTTTEKETSATTAEKETSTTAAKPKKKSNKFTIKLYTDKNSKSYKSLKKPEVSFKTGIGGVYSDDYMRFVCDADDVVVTLVELSYNDFRGEFDESEPVFSIKTKKGVVYEFKAYLGETMPPAKLKAEKGGQGAEFILQMNGKDARTDFTIKSAKKPK